MQSMPRGGERPDIRMGGGRQQAKRGEESSIFKLGQFNKNPEPKVFCAPICIR